MDNCKIISAIPIVNEECKKLYKGMVYDGCCFYLTVPDCRKIYKYDCNFGYISCCRVCQPYTCLCYDTKDCCFWATVDRDSKKLYKLDDNFSATGCILLDQCGEADCAIAGISYDRENDMILVAFSNFIARISKDGNRCSCLMQTSCKNQYRSIAAAAPFFVTAYTTDSEQMLSLCSNDCKCMQSVPFSCDYIILAMVLSPLENAQKEHTLYLLTCSNGSFFILLCCLSFDCCNTGSCNNDYCNSHCCKHDCCDDDCCKHLCPELCEYEIIGSIALVEAAISHILNAEGEKLQKAVSCSNSIEDMLEINKSVNRTIINVTHLEHVLYAKLQAIEDYCSSKASSKDCPLRAPSCKDSDSF